MCEVNGLVSVILPNYNHGKYLQQRIESILSQTVQNFELIILDDCSTDNSVEIIKQYESNQKVSKIILNSKNTGSPFKQWKKGIENAKGEYIWIAESDDWCEPTFLEHLLTPLTRDPNIVISYCQSYCVKEGAINWLSSHPQLEESISGKKFISDYLVPVPAIFNASMAIWKKEVFNQISKNFEKLSFCGDWLFWIEVAQQGTISISGRVLNYFRKHNHDVSGPAFESGLNFIEEIPILQYCFRNSLINQKKYRSAIKRKIKEYNSRKHKFSKERKKEIEKLFTQEPSSFFFYLKCSTSSLWQRLKLYLNGSKKQ